MQVGFGRPPGITAKRNDITGFHKIAFLYLYRTVSEVRHLRVNTVVVIDYHCVAPVVHRIDFARFVVLNIIYGCFHNSIAGSNHGLIVTIIFFQNKAISPVC